jgi:hypothetical protein
MFRNSIKPYSNNEEYRQSLREFFQMSSNINDIPQCIDEESYDELLYDTVAVKNGLDQIYKDTKDHIEFQKLYKKAAEAMLSEDLEIGLAICLCYDHFYKFSIYLQEFYLDFENWKTKTHNNVL